jgi:hypothetical protein
MRTLRELFAAFGVLFAAWRDATRYRNCPHADEETGGFENDARDTRTAWQRARDWIFGAPACTGTFNRCPRCLRRVVPIIFGVVLFAGEWVTSEKTGARICRAAYTVVTEMQLSRSMCMDWQIPIPPYAASLDQYRDWIRARPTGGYEIHTEKGWRP